MNPLMNNLGEPELGRGEENLAARRNLFQVTSNTFYQIYPGLNSNQCRKVPVLNILIFLGDIVHRGYGEYDDGQRILPKWANPKDLDEIERIKRMKYSPYHVDLPEARRRPPEKDGPPCPHVWESHETVDELYKLLDTVS